MFNPFFQPPVSFNKTTKSIQSTLGSLSLCENPFTKELRYFKEYPINQTLPPITESSSSTKESRMKLTSPFLLKCFDSKFKNYDYLQFESTYFEYFEKTLADEVFARKYHNSFYNESEVFQILEGLIEALLALKSIGISHGGLYPKSIFKSNSQYKIADHSLFLSDPDWFYNRCLYAEIESRPYLSPYLINCLKDHNPEYLRTNKEKDDIFSLGMTLLSCLTLEDPNIFYNEKLMCFEFMKINAVLLQLSRRYSKDLLDILSKMVAENESFRVSIQELNSFLRRKSGKPDNFDMIDVDKIINCASNLLKNEASKKSGNPTTLVQTQFISDKSPDPHEKFNNNNNINNNYSPRFETSYQTPQKNVKSPMDARIHQLTPGSLGKNSIKITYTPSKKVEERNKFLEEEYAKNMKRIESEKKSAERSIGVLRDTIEFLKNVNGSPLNESRVIDVNKL